MAKKENTWYFFVLIFVLLLSRLIFFLLPVCFPGNLGRNGEENHVTLKLGFPECQFSRGMIVSV
ncbi:hypothetical protein ACE6H2_014132 [Prunus campanulata]